MLFRCAAVREKEKKERWQNSFKTLQAAGFMVQYLYYGKASGKGIHTDYGSDGRPGARVCEDLRAKRRLGADGQKRRETQSAAAGAIEKRSWPRYQGFEMRSGRRRGSEKSV